MRNIETLWGFHESNTLEVPPMTPDPVLLLVALTELVLRMAANAVIVAAGCTFIFRNAKGE